MDQQEAEEFVRLWQTSSDTKTVAEKLGISRNAVRTHAARLRKMGVPLKMRKKGRRGPKDYAALIRLAQELESV